MSKFATIVLLCSSFLLASCKKELRINLPSAFHGRVEISCGQGEDTGTVLDVDPLGEGSLASCPADGRLLILRDGKKIELLNPPDKIQTGDGIVTGIEFTVP